MHITIDRDYPASKAYWKSARRKLPIASLNFPALSAAYDLVDGKAVWVESPETREELLSWLASIPGWDKGSPQSPHPVTVG